jgi:hypothetical protein
MVKVASWSNRHPLPHHPANHPVGMKVPKGGSDCQKCKYLTGEGKKCKNEKWIDWHGNDVIPEANDEYCCDFFTPMK